MPRPFTCSFRSDERFVFPDRCVWCGKSSPGDKHIYSVKQGLNVSRFGGWHRVEVPCCKGCGVRLTTGRLLRGARYIAIVAAVAIPATWLLYHYTPLRDAALGGTVFGIICVVALGNAVYEMFHPPRFAVDLTGQTVDFEFADRAYAEEFAALNGMSFGSGS